MNRFAKGGAVAAAVRPPVDGDAATG